MARKDIVVIGSSAGGITALKKVCASLPRDLPASVFVVQHLSPSHASILPQILSRAGPLPASSTVDGQPIEPGRIYVAAPDRHLVLEGDRVWLRQGPHENFARPSINVLFRSAALAFATRVIGVVLTGLLDDGTKGLIAIKAAGGTAVVQDPADAEWPSMPENALKRHPVDHIVRLASLAPLLVRLVQEEADAPRQPRSSVTRSLVS